jgi:hypothetical protein
MKALLILVVVVVAFVVALGFYQKWFTVTSKNADGESDITLKVNTDKFQEDKKTALEKVHKLEGQVKDKIAPSDEKKKDKVATPEQPLER